MPRCAVIFLGLMLVFISDTRSLATEVQCAGIDDSFTLQNALDAGGRIAITGRCETFSPLSASVARIHLVGPGVISSNASPILIINYHDITIERLELEGPGIGIKLVEGSLRIFLNDLKISTLGDGLQLTDGSGLWASGLHFNGLVGGTSYAVRILAWDTAFFNNILSEEHDGGFRIGSDLVVGNLWMSGIALDRLRTVGILVEPNVGGSVANVQMINIWAVGNPSAQASILLNAQEGSVTNIEIANGRFSSFDSPGIWIAGPVWNVHSTNLIFD